MSRFSGGWTKAYRRQADGDLHQNVYLWGLWNSLRDRAYWKEGSLIWMGKQIRVKPGQVIVGLKEYAKLWGIAKSTVKYWLDYLVSSERITYQTSNKGTLVTILNWERYQGDDDVDRTPVERQSNASRTTVEQRPPLSEEGKKVRRKNIHVELPELAKMWNDLSQPAFPKVIACSSSRRKHVAVRWEESIGDPFEYWSKVINKMNESGFLKGGGDTGWRATFDWLIKPDNHSKVLEGHYSGKGGSDDDVQRMMKDFV